MQAYTSWVTAQLLAKMLGWAVIGVFVRFGFAGMKGFVALLVEHHLPPMACTGGLARAVALSTATNLFMGLSTQKGPRQQPL